MIKLLKHPNWINYNILNIANDYIKFNSSVVIMKGKPDELFFDSYEKYYEELLKKN